MISEFSTTPKPSNNKAKHLFFALLISAVLVSALYVTLPQYKGIVGMIALILIVAAIYVYNRYMALTYHYEVMIDSSGTPLLIIRHTIGKRESTLCRVELASIISVERQTAEERKRHTTPEGCVRYYYAPTLAPDITCLITLRSRYEYAEITVEGSDEFIDLIASYAKQARADLLITDEDE